MANRSPDGKHGINSIKPSLFSTGSSSKSSGVPSDVFERNLGRVLVGIGYHDNSRVCIIWCVLQWSRCTDKWWTYYLHKYDFVKFFQQAQFLFFCSYGDRSPKSTLGRVFCIFWIITGLIIISIFIAMVTASLAAATHPHFPIHGSLVRESPP